MGFGILLLLGLGFATFFTGEDNPEDDTTAPEDPVPVDPNADQLLVDDGNSATIAGGAGDDTLVGAASNAPSILTTVQLNDGNDVLDWQRGEITAYGGGGDDTLSEHQGGYSILYGGTGNDVMLGTWLYGGRGDDVLQWNGPNGTDINYEINGGEGSDTLVGHATIGEIILGDNVDSSAGLVGGAGSDTFEVDLTLQNTRIIGFDGQDVAIDPTQTVTDDPHFSIRDFVKGEDLLEIQIDRTIDGVAREFTGMTFNANGANASTIDITFAGNATNPETVVTIRVDGAENLTAADVQLTLT